MTGSVDDEKLIMKKHVDTLDGKRDQGDTSNNTLTEIDALNMKIGVAETDLKEA